VYAADDLASAQAALDRLDRWCDGVQLLELSRLARTVRAWEAEILAWHRTAGCSNGPTEAIDLHCGVRWQTHRTARLRDRAPCLVAKSLHSSWSACDRGVTIIMSSARGTSSLSARARHALVTMTTCGHSCW
jgi:Transposase